MFLIFGETGVAGQLTEGNSLKFVQLIKRGANLNWEDTAENLHDTITPENPNSQKEVVGYGVAWSNKVVMKLYHRDEFFTLCHKIAYYMNMQKPALYIGRNESDQLQTIFRFDAIPEQSFVDTEEEGQAEE